MPCLRFHIPSLPILLLLLGGLPACAAPPASAPATSPGADWTDPQSKLSWARCVEGMQWTGKACTGQALLLTHAQAIARATARAKEEGLAWRVPRVPELRHLLEKSAKAAADAPPAAPAGWLWTASANVRQDKPNPYNYGNVMSNRGSNANDTPFLLGWAVESPGGAASGDIPKSRLLAVRLVRSAP